MNDGPVYEDYKKFRDFDAGKQAQKHINKSLIISFICVLLPLGIVYSIGIQTGMSSFAFLLIGLFLCMFIMGPVIFYYNGRNDTKMNMAHQGYNIEWQPNREKLFGYDAYHILRADPGRLQSAIIGFNTNPFSVSSRTLQTIEKEQREGATCKVCSNSLFEKRAFDREGAYFVEKRKRLWLFGCPVKEKIIEWDTYCPQHKPKTEQYQN